MSRAPQRQKHVYDYRIRAGGEWVCQGNPVLDKDLACLLSRSLSLDPQGGYLIRCQGEVHPVRVEDAPLLVEDLDLETDARDRLVRVGLVLADGRRFSLDNALAVSASNRLYATIPEIGLEALFNRQAYYRLTKFMDQDGQGYFIPVAGQRFYIRQREARGER